VTMGCLNICSVDVGTYSTYTCASNNTIKIDALERVMGIVSNSVTRIIPERS
jgi:hypothetical protein